jgi:hypothetical protein
MSDDTPLPQPDGFLDPPRRFPPTAIATATPPPPRRHVRVRRGRRSRVAIVVYTLMLGAAGVAGAVVGALLPLAIGVGAAFGLSGALFALRTRRKRRSTITRSRPGPLRRAA